MLASSTAPGAIIMPDYVDFEPICHWKRGQEHDTLEVNVPGFEKDQLKVQLSDAGVVIISGERPLHETKTKWSRFKKEIRPSKYCKNDEIQAKFSGEVLHIMMPKIQEQSKLLPENQENERNIPKTTLDTTASNIKGKEMRNGKNIVRSKNSKLSSYGGYWVRELTTNKKMARNVALAVAILCAFVIYKYWQPSYVNDN